jgi:hypothetical protein
MRRSVSSWLRGASRAALVVALASCGSSSSLGTDGGGGTTGGGGSGGSGPALRDPHCPAALPMNGAACTAMVDCDYDGGDTKHACATRATCTSGLWSLSKPSATCGTHPSPCPATYGSLAAGAACPAGLTGVCDYDEGRCTCMTCYSGAGVPAGQSWACRKWDDGGASCPPVSPLAGTSCSMESQFCYYSGFCSIGVGSNYECTGGYWRVQLGPAGSCALRQCGAATM